MVKIDKYAGQEDMTVYTEKIKTETAKPKKLRNGTEIESELYAGQKTMQSRSDKVNQDIKQRINSMFGDKKTPVQKKAVHKNGLPIEQGGASHPIIKKWMKGDKSF